MMNQKQQERPFYRDSFNLAYLLARCHESCLVPFLRGNFGENYFGVPALLGLGLMLLLFAGTGDEVMLAYLLLWLVMLCAQKSQTRTAIRKGRRMHSRYLGDSVFRTVKGVSPQYAIFVEIPACLVVGTLVWPASIVLGEFWLCGAGSLCVCRLIEEHVTRMKKRSLQDAMAEADWMQDAFDNLNRR